MKTACCKFPKCNAVTDLQRHHITYVTKKSGLLPHIETICEYHHDRITAIYKSISDRSGELDNSKREELWSRFISGEIIAVNFAEAKGLKFTYGQALKISEARNNAFVVAEKVSGVFFILGYSNGLKWEACPICGSKL